MTASITNRSVVPFLQPQVRSLVITPTLPNVVAVIINGSRTYTSDEHDTLFNSRQVEVD